MDPLSEIIWATFDPRTNALRVDMATSVTVDGQPISKVEDVIPLLPADVVASIVDACRNTLLTQVATAISTVKGRTVTVAVPLPPVPSGQ